MLISEIEPGTTIQIVATIQDQQFEFDSRVFDLHKKDVLIEAIRMNDKLLNIQGDNVAVDLVLFRENDKPLIWRNVEIVCKKYKSKIYYAVNKELVAKEYNRRREYRLFVGEEIHARVGHKKVDRIVVLKDISNNGFSFIYQEPIEDAEGAFVYMTYPVVLNEKRTEIPLFGKVVRKMDLPDGRTLYGCVLMKKNEMIGHYINQRQMELLARQT